MKVDELRKLLIEEYDYPNANVDIVVNQVSAFSPMWATAFFTFLSNGTLSDFTCEEYTVKGLIDEMGFTPIGAFLTMDSLMKSPDETAKMLKRGIR